MRIYLMENSSHFTQGKPAATESCNPTLINYEAHARSCSCFHNPPNSYMDYRIFNVRTWSFLCMRIHTHRVGHTDSESAQHFLLWKTHNFILWHRRGSNLGSLDLESDALSTEPPHHAWVPVTKSKNPWKLRGSGGMPPLIFLKTYDYNGAIWHLLGHISGMKFQLFFLL